MELTPIERLAIAQAIQKSVGRYVETGNPDNLRGRVDAEMKKRYESDPMAGKSYDVKLFGEKVGTYSLTVSKPKQQETVADIQIDDYDRFMKWCIREGFIEVNMESVLLHFRKCGELPDGCTPIELVKLEDPGGQVTRTTLKVEPAKVAEVLGERAALPLTKLLEGTFEND